MSVPNKNAVLALALEQANNWLTERGTHFHVELVNPVTARSRAWAIEKAASRQVEWNWEALFHKKVKNKDAWMFALVNDEQTHALCYGQILIKDGHVAMNYLEKASHVQTERGLVASVAFQFARAVALLLDLNEVRVNEPFPELVEHYERVLGGVRHTAGGAVKYVHVKVQP